MTDDFSLWLYSLKGIGSRQILGLRTKFGADAQPGEIARYLQIGAGIRSDFDVKTWKRRISEIREELEKAGVQAIPAWSSEYPALLSEIPDKPAFLFVLGEAAVLSGENLVTVVGTRKISEYGRNSLEEVLRPLISRGISIVSGLAVGIDAAAHRIVCGSVLPGDNKKSISRPVAVLPGGPKDGCPLVNRALFETVASRGAVVWEFLPRVPIVPGMFAVRNRILAGLSRCTIVIESGERGGSCITAQTALEYNRDVGAVPGSIFSEASRGTNALISEGAHVVRSGWDVIELLDGAAVESGTPHAGDNSMLISIVSDILTAIRCPAAKQDEARRVLLSEGMDGSSLNQFSVLDGSELRRVLTRLELEGILRRNHEGKIKLSAASS